MEIKLEQVKGIGPKILQLLRNENIWSTYDLVLRYPTDYENFVISELSKAKDKEKITINAKIVSNISYTNFKKVNLSTFFIQSDGIKLKAISFNKPYIINTYNKDDLIIVSGVYYKYKKEFRISKINKHEKHVSIKANYKVKGISDYKIREIINTIFTNNLVKIYETIPDEFLQKYRLLNRNDRLKKIHLPQNEDDLLKARRSLKYEEAFYLQLKLLTKRKDDVYRPPKTFDLSLLDLKLKSLPYTLTNDQKQCLNDIINDFQSNNASYRLIEGDVGSGKTLVAGLAIYLAYLSKEQSALMAPTLVLANQHYHYLKELFPKLNICLLTSNTINKKSVKDAIKNHQYDLIIGTKALIEQDVEFSNLGLVVIDEQHKFGVKTREELLNKAKYKDIIYLTATPIPRTLALLAFGKNRQSIIKEKPTKGKDVKTVIISNDEKEILYQEMKKRLANQEQIFLVVPAIESDKITDNITSVYEDIKNRFLEPIFVLHGKMSNEEKEKAMVSFSNKKGSIMLATTVIEVGIDVKNATLIAIFQAERFGLSQLHQLRGRVGRNDLDCSCYLISEKNDIERINVLKTHNDGFKLAEFDLIERGPGDFLGSEQSGFIDLNFINLLKDEVILKEAYQNVVTLLNKKDFKTNPQYRYLNKYINETLKI